MVKKVSKRKTRKGKGMKKAKKGMMPKKKC